MLTIEEKERYSFLSGNTAVHTEILDRMEYEEERERLSDMVRLIDAAITAYYDKKSTPRHAFKIIRDAILMHAPDDMQ